MNRNHPHFTLRSVPVLTVNMLYLELLMSTDVFEKHSRSKTLSLDLN